MNNANEASQRAARAQISCSRIRSSPGGASESPLISDDVSAMQAFARRLAHHCAAFKGADDRRSVWQLIFTLGLFLGLLATMYAAVDAASWLALLLALPAAGLLVRLFIIQHDCGHGSFFSSRRANDLTGRLISVFTLTPYGHWRQHHALHHATSGNLDERGFGDIHTLTVREYDEMPALKRLLYRLYRNPLVMILLGAPINFMVLQRFPIGRALPNHTGWGSVISLNLALLLVFGTLVAFVGVKPVLMVYLPISLVGSWVGGWLFFVQHQFEETEWDQGAYWHPHHAALRGSSYLALPPILQWFTGNIGLHQVHHLCPRIPNYRLQECLDASPELREVSRRLTFLDSIRCARLTLWDETRRKLIRFCDRPAPACTS